MEFTRVTQFNYLVSDCDSIGTKEPNRQCIRDITHICNVNMAPTGEQAVRLTAFREITDIRGHRQLYRSCLPNGVPDGPEHRHMRGAALGTTRLGFS